MTRIDACPHCGALHAPVIVWVDGQQSLCCPDKIYVPFERKEEDDEQLLPLHGDQDIPHLAA